MIMLYVILLDFLIPFLCDPDLQCRHKPLPDLTLLKAMSLLKTQRGADIQTDGSSSPGTDLYLI